MKRILTVILSLCISTPLFAVDYTQDANCVGAWLFREGSGTTVDDASSGGNDGAFQSSGHPAWDGDDKPTIATYSINLAGTPDSVTVSHNFQPGTGAFSLSFWLKTTNTGTIVAVSEYATTNWWCGLSGGNLRWSVGGTDRSGTTDIADGAWHHVAVSRNASNTIVYLDGSVEVASSANLNMDSTGNFTIGCFTGVGFYFVGRIAEVAVFDRELSSNEITEIMTYGLEGDGDSPTNKVIFFE